MPKERLKLIPAVYLFLVRDGKVLLSRRFNTGYSDGNYSTPAGHIEPGETLAECLVREAKEEVGIDIKPARLSLVHVLHREKDGYMDFFFESSDWEGEARILEPDKCDDLAWFELDKLPGNIAPEVEQALDSYKKKSPYSEIK